MNKILIAIYFTSIVVLANLPIESFQGTQTYLTEDVNLNFTQLAKKYIGPCETFNVTTEDGYILSLFHLAGNKTKPVLLVHGVLDSGDTFVLRGNNSLAAVLIDEGYDVWVANLRGTKYSRTHLTLTPDNRKYWDFDLHEFGVYDLPAIIDFILSKTQTESLSGIGHSQGNMVFYVLGSTKPEYNEKINLLIALGPVCFLNEENMSFPIKSLIELGPLINDFLEVMGENEIAGETSAMIKIQNLVCTQIFFGYKICGYGLFAKLAGDDMEEFEYDFFYVVIGHYPTSTSRKNAVHLLQIAKRGQFAQYDYGKEQNMKKYGQKTPPLYNLGLVTMKTALLVGLNDKVTPLKNVNLLRAQLPNVVKFKVMEREQFNHIDHVWGRNMRSYLFPDVLELLKTYR